MSKKKFKLDLNKSVISRMQANDIKGGGTHVESENEWDLKCKYPLIHFKSDGPTECPWSIHTNSNDSPN